MKTVVKLAFGSHLYGTNTPSSDLDFKSVHIPSSKDIILQRAKEVYSNSTKAQGQLKNSADDVDNESYSLQKYLKLVLEGQTVALDMLFVPFKYQITNSTTWNTILDNKHKLLSKKYMSFVGYCRTQANKYGIKGSRMAAAKRAVEVFEAAIEGFGGHSKVAQALVFVRDNLRGTEHIEFDIANHYATNLDLMLSVCDRKCQYGNSLKNAYEMYKRLYDEYGQRAKDAMNNENIDWKAMSHAVRIGEQAVELLQTGNVVFPRPNAAYLVEIKTGKHPFSEVADYIERLLVDIELQAGMSKLPAEPDYAWVEAFVYEMYRNEIINNS